MVIVLNAFTFQCDQYLICFDTDTRRFYIDTIFEYSGQRYTTTLRYESLERLFNAMYKRYLKHGGSYYRRAWRALEETINSPVMPLVRALLVGE